MIGRNASCLSWFDYVMTAKVNQPELLETVFKMCFPMLAIDPDHVAESGGVGGFADADRRRECHRLPTRAADGTH